MTDTSQSTMRSTPTVTVADLLQELEREARATHRILERVPGGQLDWAPHNKSMSLGQLAMHIALIPGNIAELSRNSSFDVKTAIPRPTAGSTAEIVQRFDESLQRARRALGATQDEDLQAPWNMMKGAEVVFSMTRGELLRTVMLNHWYHHRGQLTVYLRMLDVPLPAIYGESADERVMSG
jgi:uncharacterized damage-inducible protein DinB